MNSAVPHVHFLPGQGLLLKDLNTPWREVLHLGARRSFAPGSLMEEAHGEVFFFIGRGLVRMTYSNENGQVFLISHLGQNTLCGEALVEAASRSCRFCCLDQVEAWAFRKELLMDVEFVRAYPHLFQNLLTSSTAKLVQLFRQACNVVLHTPVQRLCAYVRYLVREQGLEPVPGISQEELAAFLGMHRSSLTRALTQLRDEGVIGSFSKKKLVVLNLPRLEELAGN